MLLFAAFGDSYRTLLSLGLALLGVQLTYFGMYVKILPSFLYIVLSWYCSKDFAIGRLIPPITIKMAKMARRYSVSFVAHVWLHWQAKNDYVLLSCRSFLQ